MINNCIPNLWVSDPVVLPYPNSMYLIKIKAKKERHPFFQEMIDATHTNFAYGDFHDIDGHKFFQTNEGKIPFEKVVRWIWIQKKPA